MAKETLTDLRMGKHGRGSKSFYAHRDRQVAGPSHYAGAILWMFEKGALKFLVLRDGENIKFPGGTNKDNLHETPLETLKRELFEETDVQGSGSWIPIYTHSETNGSRHTRHFFINEKAGYEGKLRTESKMDGDDVLGVPEFVDVNDLQYKFRLKHHQHAFRAALEHLVMANRDVALAIAGLLQ